MKKALKFYFEASDFIRELTTGEASELLTAG
jgi:hypothetical protein